MMHRCGTYDLCDRPWPAAGHTQIIITQKRFPIALWPQPYLSFLFGVTDPFTFKLPAALLVRVTDGTAMRHIQGDIQHCLS
jgi:hypothetical protein